MEKRRIVGIIGSERESHTIYLAQEIARQGGEPLILDAAPDRPFPLTLDENRGAYYQGIDLRAIKAFYLRTLFIPTPAFDIEPLLPNLIQEGYVAYASERERYAAWISFLKRLSQIGKEVINDVDTLLMHFAKPYQLTRLGEFGLPVPKTLVTSDPEAVLRFAASGPLVYKPIAGGALTRLVQEEDLSSERLSLIVHAPVMFQEYIKGKDIRVFVLDGEVIAAFYIEGVDIDYRAGKSTVKPFHPSEELRKLSIMAAKAVGMTFTGIDFKEQADGHLVILECNPAPMFMGFDQYVEGRIVKRLAKRLLNI